MVCPRQAFARHFPELQFLRVGLEALHHPEDFRVEPKPLLVFLRYALHRLRLQKKVQIPEKISDQINVDQQQPHIATGDGLACIQDPVVVALDLMVQHLVKQQEVDVAGHEQLRRSMGQQ